MLTTRIKAALLYSGIVLMAASVILGMGFFTGLIDLPDNVITGEATLHSIARIAVIGCLLAAIGSFESE